jgi:DNA-binding NarL/FixJ family response regulator
VMLTVSQDSGDLLAALRAGAVGYLPKDTRPDSLPAALCGVLAGEAAVPRALTALVLKSLRGGDHGSSPARVRVRGVELSARESQVFRLLRTGMRTIDISEALSLSPVTVRRHISAGVARLGVADREAAIRALDTTAAA